MNARDRILARLGAAAPAVPPPEPDVGAWYGQRRRNESADQRSGRFRTMIEAAHAEVHPVSEADWLQKLYEVLAARRLTSLLLPMATARGARAGRELAAAGLACLPYDSPIETWKETLFQGVDAAFTEARSAIAETGTLILWPGAEEPRLMSLVPPVHVVLVDAATIHATFYDAMTDEGWTSGLPTNALLISGPSKTADIQQTLAYGAHGPKELIVLLKGVTP